MQRNVKMQWNSLLGFTQRRLTVPKVYFFLFFCIRSSVSDVEVNLSQQQDCGSSLSNSSLSNNFLQLNLALLGKCFLCPGLWELQNKTYLSPACWVQRKGLPIVTTDSHSIKCLLIWTWPKHYLWTKQNKWTTPFFPISPYEHVLSQCL